MIHDPHFPAPEMCSECGEYPVPEDHDCEPPYRISFVKVSIILTVLSLDCLIGWSIWKAIHYLGWMN